MKEVTVRTHRRVTKWVIKSIEDWPTGSMVRMSAKQAARFFEIPAKWLQDTQTWWLELGNGSRLRMGRVAGDDCWYISKRLPR